MGDLFAEAVCFDAGLEGQATGVSAWPPSPVYAKVGGRNLERPRPGWSTYARTFENSERTNFGEPD
jgi:hypothetical protein